MLDSRCKHALNGLVLVACLILVSYPADPQAPLPDPKLCHQLGGPLDCIEPTVGAWSYNWNDPSECGVFCNYPALNYYCTSEGEAQQRHVDTYGGPGYSYSPIGNWGTLESRSQFIERLNGPCFLDSQGRPYVESGPFFFGHLEYANNKVWQVGGGFYEYHLVDRRRGISCPLGYEFTDDPQAARATQDRKFPGAHVYCAPPCSAPILQLTGPSNVEPQNVLSGFEASVTRCNGNPAVGVSVGLSVEVVENSGFHGHHDASRPTGEVQPSVVVTDGSGKASFSFAAPEPAGIHLIAAQCTSLSCSTPVPLEVMVKVEGLEPIPAASSLYTLTDAGGGNIGDNGRHDGANHNLTPDAAGILQRVAFSYYAATFVDQSNRQPDKIHVNDASLPWGGLFDINGNWSRTPGHIEHRRGTVVDIRANSQLGSIPAAHFESFKRAARKTGADAGLHSPGKPNQHFHVRLRGAKE